MIIFFILLIFKEKQLILFIFLYLILKHTKPNSILIDSFITYKQNIFFNFKKDLSLIKDKDFKNEITTKFSKETLIDDLISIYEMLVIF